METQKVIIPEEKYSIFKITQDNIVGIAMVNSSLAAFEPKVVFGWHLHLKLELKDVFENTPKIIISMYRLNIN